MKGTSLGVLACPYCEYAFKIAGGFPHFIEPDNLTGLNKSIARIYDRVSWGYQIFRGGSAWMGSFEPANLSAEIQSKGLVKKNNGYT
jgi:hypothetical protein